jgi:hypothetical protein
MPSSKSHGSHIGYLRSKRSALLEGLGSVINILPEPRSRSIRACQIPAYPVSINEAIAADWAAVGGDMWTSIHASEEPSEETTAAEQEHQLST